MTANKQYKMRYVFNSGGIAKGTVFEGDLDSYSGLIKAGVVQVIEKVKSDGDSKKKTSRTQSHLQKSTYSDKSVTSSFESSDEQDESTRRYGSNEKDNGFYDTSE